MEVSLHPRLRGFDPRSHAIQTGSVRIKTAQDGGGKARAALKTIRGVELVTRFISGIWQRYLSELDYRLACKRRSNNPSLKRPGIPAAPE